MVIWDDYYCDAIGDDLVCWDVFGGVDGESRGDHDYVYDQVLTSLTALERGWTWKETVWMWNWTTS